MIIVTGPQSTTEDRESLAEAAGLLEAHLTCSTDVLWIDVSALYCLDGWEICPLAVADVSVAEAMDIPIKPFSF